MPSMLMKSLRHWLIVASRTFLWLWTSMRSFPRFCCSAWAPKWNQRNMGSTSTSHLVKHSNQSTFRYPQFNRGSRWHTVNMDLPKTTSPKMKTTKKMNNVQSQTKIKLHQLIRKILARFLCSSLDPLQQKNTLAADHAKQKPKHTVLKYDVIEWHKTAYVNQDQQKHCDPVRTKGKKQSVT